MREGRNEGVEAARCKFGHSGGGFAHTRKYHLVGSGKQVLVIGVDPISATYAGQRIGNRAYVADGKEYKVAEHKPKNLKHLKPVGAVITAKIMVFFSEIPKISS